MSSKESRISSLLTEIELGVRVEEKHDQPLYPPFVIILSTVGSLVWGRRRLFDGEGVPPPRAMEGGN